ncbi:hypothetical protein GQ457_10G005940 [Hibiscus cannabinus]
MQYEEKKNMQLNSKEIRDKLEVTNEGTNEVKKTKIGLLNLSYENFKMDPKEDIKAMYDRLSTIVNKLKGFWRDDFKGKASGKFDLLTSQIMRFQEEEKIIVAKNLKTLNLDKLNGSLLTCEMMSKGKMNKEANKEKCSS